MVLVLLVGGAIRPAFFSTQNLVNVADQTTVLIILSIGLSIAMLLRGVDLSVAQVTDAGALLAAALVAHGQPIWLAFLAPILLGLCIGAVNGMLMGYLGVPAIIGTLGMMFVIRSGELIYSHGGEPQILFTLPPGDIAPFLFLGQGKLGPFPVVILFCLVVVLVMHFVTRATVFGRRMDAVGVNARAAFLSAVKVKQVFAGGFVLSGILAAIAGTTLASWSGIAAPRSAERYLLDGFVAVYLGTLVSKTGKISVLGTVAGALFVGCLGNQLTLLGLGAASRAVSNGAFVLIAIAVGAVRRRAD
jgi:ribose/xylose/arabinose/galactoside ABC-type transport system permease subunit